MANNSLISVVVSVLNNARTIQRCIDSVIAQTCIKFELIIIDGDSSDGTKLIIEKNSDRIAYWESKPDRGIYDAWNKALNHTKGEWICFLGADDRFYDNEVLNKLSRALKTASPDYRVVYGRVAMASRSGDILNVIGEPWDIARDRFRKIMNLPHPGLMNHRSLFSDNGRFDETFKIAGDYDFLLRELMTGCALFVPDVITVIMETGGLSTSPANQLATLSEARRAQRSNGIRYPSLLWVKLLLRAWLLLILWKVLGDARAKSILDKIRIVTGKSRYWGKI